MPAGPPIVRSFSMQESIKPGRLVVSIKDTDGNPLTGTVLLNGAEHPISGIMTAEHFPGTVVVTGTAPDFMRQSVEVEVLPKESTRIELVLETLLAEVTTERIEIRDSVYFETDRAIISPESFSLLNQVAQILSDHQEITLIRIEGHTDSRGSAAANLSLSRRRAAAVRTYLIEQGVAEARLVSEGFGERRPIAEGNSAEAWSQNRRVDFFIAGRADEE